MESFTLSRIVNTLKAAWDVWNGQACVGRYELRAKLTRADGSVVDYGVVSRKKVTLAFVQQLVDVLAAGAIGDFQSFKYHQTGTGSVAESNADTTLGAAVDSRVTGTQTTSNPGGSTRNYISEATITYAGSYTVREHGLFSASSGGTLMDRSVLATPIPVNASDQITFNYTLSVMAES